MKKLALALLAPPARFPPSTSPHKQPLPPAPSKVPLELGAAWYPEQWPESRWDADLTLMEQAHMHFTRVGEFAWSTMEPSEGNFQLDWLEHAIRLAEKHHIAIVIGTPTAAPPAWLTQKYPETLRTNPDGRKDEHGNRQQFDFANPKYRELCRIIATKLAERFGHDPNVIGWQIDNEYAAEDFGPETRTQFQQWLKAKYKTLDNLNARWTTAYWSETYSAWDQIPIQETYGNPGLLLNWKQFVSDTWRSYQRNQLDAIRAHADKRQFITTNMMGWFDAYDHYTVAQDLDLASWDDYIGTGQIKPDENGARHDLTRGFLRKNFWVMETQPGFVNWSPGQQRAQQRRNPRHGLERHRPRLRGRRVLAVAQRAQRAGAIPRHARRRRRHARPALHRGPADRRRLRQSRPRARRHHRPLRRRSPQRLSLTLGHRLAAPQQGLRSRPGLHELLHAAA